VAAFPLKTTWKTPIYRTGRINLSGYAYDLIKDLIKDRFPCEYRGRVNAKGKGEIDMYFINQSSQ
jgi:hypothetical protein